jgi:membrane protein
MKGLFLKIKKDYSNILLYILGLIYFVLLLPYYLIDYYVPDFRLYFSMAFDGAKARDGFSSLFIWFAGLATSIPKQLTVFCLVLMSLSIIQISFFIKFFFKRRKYLYYVSILTLYSSCCFYYFYGKIFYDFPFTAFTYSLCLLILKKLITKNQNMEKIDKEWFLFCSLLGFLLSWKPYNIFPLVGLILLMFTKKESKNILTKILKSLKKMGISILFFIFGYVVGNYNLLFYPKATIDGIKAYSARCGFKLFLMGKTRILWDHVNDMPFNVSVMTVVTVIIFLYILPILFKKFEFLLISIFMTICFYLFISYFSPGYAWHGFTIGLFIITYIIFFLSELKEETEKKQTVKKILIGVAILIQAIVCFVYYIPLQNKWYLITEEAIKILENKESEIYSDVLYLINNKIGTDDYMIDVALKRYKPVALFPLKWRKINIKNTYIVAENYTFLNPLEAINYDGWSQINGKEEGARYIIWILTDNFKRMGDVADVNIYNNDKFNIVDRIHGKGYTVYLYKVN